jgi:hypothetical protein
MMRYMLLLALAATGVHAERTVDYATGVTLLPAPGMPFQRVVVPAAVYEGTVRPALADVRVFNADGELVPFAWLPRPGAARERPETMPLPHFPLIVDAAQRDVSGLSLQVVRDASGTTVDIRSTEPAAAGGREVGGYVLDATALAQPLHALRFALPPAGGAPVMHLRIDGSDDLASWRSVVPDATLVNLEYEGRRLTRDRIDLPPTRARYLRLSWVPGRPAIAFTGVTGEFAERVVESPRQWRDASPSPVPDHPGEFEYDLGGGFPIDRIDVRLAETNSIVPAEVLARGAASAPWRPVASTVFYRLREPDGDVMSLPAAVAPAADRYWLLRVDPRAGLSASTAPPLRAGWQPAELVFAARGAPPFTLAYGNRTAAPGALPIATLVPGYDSVRGAPSGMGDARMGAPAELGGPDRLREPPDVKRWMLWASLALGAIVLGWMAWRLSRELSVAPERGDADPPRD